MPVNNSVAPGDASKSNPLEIGKLNCKLDSHKSAFTTNNTNDITLLINKKIIYYPHENPNTNRRDACGTEINHRMRKHRISFRDDVKKTTLVDIHEIEPRAKKNPCSSCIII
jgi:hypothetical protein